MWIMFEKLDKLYGGLDIIANIRLGRLKWIEHLNRIPHTKMAKEIFTTHPEEPDCRVDRGTDGGMVFAWMRKEVKYIIGCRLRRRGKSGRGLRKM